MNEKVILKNIRANSQSSLQGIGLVGNDAEKLLLPGYGHGSRRHGAIGVVRNVASRGGESGGKDGGRGAIG